MIFYIQTILQTQIVQHRKSGVSEQIDILLMSIAFHWIGDYTNTGLPHVELEYWDIVMPCRCDDRKAI